MSGHSKWSTIKRKKATVDAKRGKIFTRLGREITVAARQGSDPDTNFTLRLAIDRAKNANMPKENIDRAIKRGTGELKGDALEEVTYEAYAAGGVALLLEVVTDNRNRSLQAIKAVLNKGGGNMAEPGSVSWQFEQKGYLTIEATVHDYDDIFMVAAEAGAEDVVNGEDIIEVFTPRESLQEVQNSLNENNIAYDEARLDWVPKTPLDLDFAAAMKVMSVIEQLEELEDMQTVYSNLNISDDLIASFETAA